MEDPVFVKLRTAMKADGFDALVAHSLDNATYTAGFQVTGVIKRSDFGVKTYVPLVGDDVAVNINAAFSKPAS